MFSSFIFFGKSIENPTHFYSTYNAPFVSQMSINTVEIIIDVTLTSNHNMAEAMLQNVMPTQSFLLHQLQLVEDAKKETIKTKRSYRVENLVLYTLATVLVDDKKIYTCSSTSLNLFFLLLFKSVYGTLRKWKSIRQRGQQPL